MLTTLQIAARYDAAFLKTLTPIDGEDAWGAGPGDATGTQTIMFDDAYTDAVVAAVNGYDAAHLARAKAARIEAVADLRRAAIIETFAFNGVSMRLDESCENALSKAYSALQRQPEGTEVDFEVSRGVFMTFDLATVGAISDAAFVHVQACFSNARRLTALINDAGDLAALDAVDLSVGWP